MLRLRDWCTYPEIAFPHQRPPQARQRSGGLASYEELTMRNTTGIHRARKIESSMVYYPDRPDDAAERLSCVHPKCNATPQVRYEFPVPLCGRHFVRVLARAGEVTREASHEFSAQNPGKRSPIRGLSLEHDPVVYYLRFADRIKIGTSTNLKLRLASIPHDEFLGSEPGGQKLEMERHRTFAAHRLVGEWFAAAPELLAHIKSL